MNRWPNLLAALALAVSVPANAAPLLNQEHKLTDPGGVDSDNLGYAVAVSGDTVVAGAVEAGGAPHGPGKAHVYERDAERRDAWTEVQVLVPPGGDIGDLFGYSVAIDGDTLVVGAISDDDFGSYSGAVYLYERDSGDPHNWLLTKKITASDAASGGTFGGNLALEGDRLLVRADGAAYIFERDQGGSDNWGEIVRLSDADFGTGFGSCVGLSGDTVIVGKIGYLVPITFVEVGAAYIFDRDEGGVGNWGQVAQLLPQSLLISQSFGGDCAVDGDTVAVTNGYSAGNATLFYRDEGGPSNWGRVTSVAGFRIGPAHLDGDTLLLRHKGLATFYERNEGGVDNWGSTLDIAPSDPEEFELFGASLARDGDVVVAGDRVNGDADLGAVYVFVRRATPMFVTSSDQAGDLGGRSGADAICQAEADAASLGGIWQSFLSVTGDDAFARLPATLPVERLDRALLAEDPAALSISIENPLDLDASGGTAPFGTRVWTGETSGAASCSDFQATSGTGRAGVASETTSLWHDDADDACTTSNRLYCHRFVCPGTAAAGCTDSWAKGTLVVKEAKAGKEKLKIDLKNGPALTQADFGDPLFAGGTSYTTCVYDGAENLVAQLDLDRAGDLCGGKPCWLPVGDLGYRYRDKDLAADGIQQIKMKGGAPGKSKIQIKGANNATKGQTALPTGLAVSLERSTHATVQLHGNDLAECHTITLGDVRKTTRQFFHAKK